MIQRSRLPCDSYRVGTGRRAASPSVAATASTASGLENESGGQQRAKQEARQLGLFLTPRTNVYSDQCKPCDWQPQSIERTRRTAERRCQRCRRRGGGNGPEMSLE